MLRGGDKLTPKITCQMVGGGNQDRRRNIFSSSRHGHFQKQLVEVWLHFVLSFGNY
jgi:hypothetical protein